MIQINDVMFRYHKSSIVLKGINLRIEDGECLVLTGENGSGKTTLIKIILNELDRNKYEFQRNKLISYIPDKFTANVDLSIKQFLYDISVINKVESAYFWKLYDIYMVYFSLIEFEHVLLKKLSKGMKQKVNIIQALIKPYDLLIIDEILDGLDDEMKQKVVDLLGILQRQHKSLLIVTHNIPYFEDLSYRHFRLQDGRVIND